MRDYGWHWNDQGCAAHGMAPCLVVERVHWDRLEGDCLRRNYCQPFVRFLRRVWTVPVCSSRRPPSWFMPDHFWLRGCHLARHV